MRQRLYSKLDRSWGAGHVLELFKRRVEFDGKKAIFVIDQDCWIITGKPDEFDDEVIITSDGYSIENDLYRDGSLERLLDIGELKEFKSQLAVVGRWFSCAYRKIMDGDAITIDHHPRRMVSSCGTKLSEEFQASFGLGEPDEKFLEIITREYSKMIRGKTLFQLLTMQLVRKQRKSKYSYSNLLELGITANGPLLKSTIDRIKLLSAG